MMTIEIEGKDFNKSEMWLVNILRYLSGEELKKLSEQLAERVPRLSAQVDERTTGKCRNCGHDWDGQSEHYCNSPLSPVKLPSDEENKLYQLTQKYITHKRLYDDWYDKRPNNWTTLEMQKDIECGLRTDLGKCERDLIFALVEMFGCKVAS